MCFSYFFITIKRESEVSRFCVISDNLLSILRFWVMLLKKVVKDPASP